jgi:hypothetical protein
VGRHPVLRDAQGYKPQPKIYLRGVQPQVQAGHDVPAHSGDLSPKSSGLRTGMSGGRRDGGPGTSETEPKGKLDVVGRNLHDLHDKLGL